LTAAQFVFFLTVESRRFVFFLTVDSRRFVFFLTVDSRRFVFFLTVDSRQFFPAVFVRSPFTGPAGLRVQPEAGVVPESGRNPQNEKIETQSGSRHLLQETGLHYSGWSKKIFVLNLTSACSFIEANSWSSYIISPNLAEI
jgi:hypothetical protein